MLPPVTMILMTSTPRLTRSCTAWRMPSRPSASPPRNQQWPRLTVIGGPDARISGPDLRAAAEPIAQGQRDVVAVSEVPDRGHPARQRPQCSNAHPQQQGRIVALQQTGHRIVGGIEGQVLVDIDQAGQQRHITEVHHVGIVHRGPTLRHTDDPAVEHLDERVFHDRVSEAVEQALRGDQHLLPHSRPTAGSALMMPTMVRGGRRQPRRGRRRRRARTVAACGG